MTRRLPAAALVLVLALAACGKSSSSSSSTSAAKPPTKEVSPSGDIPDNQAYVAYSAPGAGFSVKVPEGWSQVQAGKAVTFTDKLNAITTASGQSAPTAAPSGATAVRTSTVKRTAGTAKRITYLIQGKADAVTGKSRTLAVERYVFAHNGTNVVLTLAGPKGADNVDPWRIVTDSLRWTR